MAGYQMKLKMLKLAILVCLALAAIRLGEFIYQRVPPFREGTCYADKESTELVVKIVKNHILEGYSDIELEFISFRADSKTSFSYLRYRLGEEVKCP
jgi:hypothetical protein